MKKLWLLILFCCIGISSCEDEFYTTIPRADVSFKLDLWNEDHSLNAKMAYKTFTSRRAETDRMGYAGLLVINGFGNSDINLYAYDLSCPVECRADVKVTPNPEMDGTASCKKCGAVYNIAEGGYPIENGTYWLRTYRVSKGNNGYYHIIN
jgi:hypothetical protein